MKILLKLAPFLAISMSALAGNTLPSIKKGEQAPETFEQLWQDFDPRKDPLEIEVLKEWEEDGAVIKVIRYAAGTFKGKKSMVAGVYGYPIGGKNLPALVNAHGGGQYADAKAVIANAKRGYATLTVSWAGRISSSKYKVNPAVVKLFWDGKTDDPKYLLTTDWGAVDGYHAPCRDKRSASAKISPHELTLDEVDSPRNSLWFLATVATRRAVTFLEQQQRIVNPDKIGIYGHSMGGKITVLTAASDSRIKAAAPSCGGISNHDNNSAQYNATLGDHINLSKITCPILFMAPANDFHGNIADLPKATELIKSPSYSISSAPHHNHQDTGEYIITAFRFFDHYLKGSDPIPSMPQTKLTLKTENGTPIIEVTPDPNAKLPIASVQIHTTQQITKSGSTSKYPNPRFKFWHSSTAVKKGNTYQAAFPITSTDKPAWIYANVTYKLPEEDAAANYYYSPFKTDRMNVSSLLQTIPAKDHQSAGIKTTLKPSLLIEDFAGDWRADWFSYHPEHWAISTNKLHNPLWAAPETKNTQLSFQLSSEVSGKMAIRLNKYAAEITLKGDNTLETFTFSPPDFKNASGQSLENWSGLEQLELTHNVRLAFRFTNDGITKTDRLELGSKTWQGPAPIFKKLEWVTQP